MVVPSHPGTPTPPPPPLAALADVLAGAPDPAYAFASVPRVPSSGGLAGSIGVTGGGSVGTAARGADGAGGLAPDTHQLSLGSGYPADTD